MRSGAYRIVFKGEGKRDLVTEADKGASRSSLTRSLGRYPDHRILAEEGTSTGGDGEYRWIVDPLDGTTNFAHQYPLYCSPSPSSAAVRRSSASSLRPT